jgi:hypothetical protein
VIIGSDVVTSSESLNRVLRRHGHVADTARRSLKAVKEPVALANLINVPNGWPLMLVSSISWDRNMRPFDNHSSWARTNIVKVTVATSAAPARRRFVDCHRRLVGTNARILQYPWCVTIQSPRNEWLLFGDESRSANGADGSGVPVRAPAEQSFRPLGLDRAPGRSAVL